MKFSLILCVGSWMLRLDTSIHPDNNGLFRLKETRSVKGGAVWRNWIKVI